MGCFDLLHSAIKINPILLGRNLEDVVKPNIAFLQQCGLTASNVPEFAMLICMKPEDVRERVACAEKAWCAVQYRDVQECPVGHLLRWSQLHWCKNGCHSQRCQQIEITNCLNEGYAALAMIIQTQLNIPTPPLVLPSQNGSSHQGTSGGPVGRLGCWLRQRCYC